jgi:putative membrane protein
MSIVAKLPVVLLAALHGYFLYLEMFRWTAPETIAAFAMTAEAAEASKVLAANQGLYNGFLAAGLLWSIFAGAQFRSLAFFFGGCALIAGLYGGATASDRIFFVQALPAALALAAVFFSAKR